MLPWRGVLIHTLFVLAQPTYLAVRSILAPDYFDNASTVWLALHAIAWIYLVIQVTIPFFTTPLRHLPSPPGERFPIGHMNFKPAPQRFEKMLRATPNDGLIVLWGPLYLSCTIVPANPEGLMDMLNAHNYDWEKPSASRRFLARTLGEGLVNVEGNKHKAMRRVIAPAFSGHNIRNLAPLFYAKGLALANSMALQTKASPDGSLEVMSQMSRATLDIIGSAGVGKDFNTVENDENSLAKLYATITDTNRGPLLLFFWIQAFVPEWLVKQFKGSVYARVAEAQTELRQEARDLMQEKKKMLVEKSEQQNDIIAVILKSGTFTDDYLVDQLLTFLAAGHDTTASALTWALWLLSTHPEIQTRLRAECTTHLSRKATPSIDASDFDTETMPYLTAVCNETLRLYPTVPITVRVSVKSTKIGAQFIPSNTTAVISQWAINHDHDLWGADAEEFRPTRWLEGEYAANGGAKSPYALLTFLHGPRSCIGRSFALMEMRCLLAVLTKRFRFEMADPEEKVEVGGFITIKPQNGMRLRLHDLEDTQQQ